MDVVKCFIVIFYLIEVVLLQPVPDLVKVRRREDAKGAEFVALDTIGLTEIWGYPVEQHNVTTEDGFILNIFRIPWSSKSPLATKQKPVIYMLSGLAASSDVCVGLGINRSLAMQLADEGYDVWMGNNRGNTYGRAHVKLSPNDVKFWAHSMHELGIYDIPNSIDYILNITKQPSLTYLGHSMAGTLILITLSERPEYNDKIHLVMLFGPSAIWVENSPMVQISAWFGEWFQTNFDPEAAIEIMPQSSTLASLFNRICIPNGLFRMCYQFLDFGVGEDYEQLDETKILDYFLYWPSGVSSRVAYHYSQGMKSGKFRQWDYNDAKKNIQHYGQLEPPEYNLTKVTSPMYIFYAKNDPLAKLKNILTMMERVSSKAVAELVRFKGFNHIDFVIAKDVKKLLNNIAIERLAQFYDGKIPFLQTNNSIY